MIYNRENAFFSPCVIEYQDASGVPVPEKNTIASRIRITSGQQEQIVAFNSDNQPIQASNVQERS